MRKKVKRRLMAVTAIMCSTAMALSSGIHIYAGEIDELQDKYDELEQQQQTIEQNLENAKDEKEKQVEIKQQLDSQITLTREQLDTLDQRLSMLEKAIEQKEDEIEQKEAEIDDNKALFEERLRSMQLNNTTSTLGLLFGSDSFSDFLSRSESIKRITQHDKDFVDKLVQDQKDIVAAKEEIEADKSEVSKTKQEIEQKESELNSKLSDAQRQIQDIEALEADYYKNKEKIESDKNSVQSEIDRIYAENAANNNNNNNSGGGSSGGGSGDYVSSDFTWPVPGYTTITSYYGWRFNNTDFHTGIDIAGGGIYGHDIVAADSGTVIFSTNSYVPGVGYGRYLIIDHGNGMSTLYGHTSQLYVSTGDYVEKGQPIAAVGSTGWSTGPHLHFEIRQNGKHTNPMNYFG